MREIIYAIKDWLVHLFDVHCDSCRHDKLEDKQCVNCEYLKMLLEHERHEREKLQSYILTSNKPDVQSEIEEEPIKTSRHFESWAMKRARLEKEDREAFREAKSAITEKLEKEVLYTKGEK